MARFRPATAVSDAIVRPPCPKCGAGMQIARIKPGEPGHEDERRPCAYSILQKSQKFWSFSGIQSFE